jgi:hypothetical protein
MMDRTPIRDIRSKRGSRALLIGFVVVAWTGLVAAPAGAATTANLIKNAGAEASAGGTGGPVAIANWQNGSTATVVKYGTPNFPTVHSPGPASRGKNFFAGGNDDGNSQHSLYQKISLQAYAAKIDGGNVTVTASGFFGGFTTQDDVAGVQLLWLDARGLPILHQNYGYVTAAQRHNVTGLLKRSSNASVPKGTRSVQVELRFNRVAGFYNDGYADNLSLILHNV